MEKLKVRFIANFPLSVVYGGFEHQCIQTCLALKAIGIDAGLLDWHGTEENDYILHLFAPDPMWARIVEYWGQRSPVVISAIAGSNKFRLKSYLANRIFAYISKKFHQETIYARTQKLLKKVDRIICINTLEQEFFVRSYDLPVEKTTIISHGVAESRYTTSEKIFSQTYGVKNFVLYVGNITQRKNPLLLAESLKQLNLQGVFIGKEMAIESQYSLKFRSVISDSPNLLWIPGLDYNDPLLSSAFAASRVLCLPSYAETQPLAAMEAMAAGKPVILGDFSYAYQPPFGSTIKVNPVNIDELKSAIKNAMDQKVSNMDRLSSEYRWNEVAGKIKQVYKDI